MEKGASDDKLTWPGLIHRTITQLGKYRTLILASLLSLAVFVAVTWWNRETSSKMASLSQGQIEASQKVLALYTDLVKNTTETQNTLVESTKKLQQTAATLDDVNRDLSSEKARYLALQNEFNETKARLQTQLQDANEKLEQQQAEDARRRSIEGDYERLKTTDGKLREAASEVAKALLSLGKSSEDSPARQTAELLVLGPPESPEVALRKVGDGTIDIESAEGLNNLVRSLHGCPENELKQTVKAGLGFALWCTYRGSLLGAARCAGGVARQCVAIAFVDGLVSDVRTYKKALLVRVPLSDQLQGSRVYFTVSGERRYPWDIELSTAPEVSSIVLGDDRGLKVLHSDKSATLVILDAGSLWDGNASVEAQELAASASISEFDSRRELWLARRSALLSDADFKDAGLDHLPESLRGSTRTMLMTAGKRDFVKLRSMTDAMVSDEQLVQLSRASLVSSLPILSQSEPGQRSQA